jgi:hypothetical protein
MLPFKIYTEKRIFNYYTGLSFFIFIWISKLTKDEVKLVRHEKIHFLQQMELLFVFHWILYAYFYIVARSKGHGHYAAYRNNPFELEAYDNECDVNYLRSRKFFAWVKNIEAYNLAISQPPSTNIPDHFKDARFRLPLPGRKWTIKKNG